MRSNAKNRADLGVPSFHAQCATKRRRWALGIAGPWALVLSCNHPVLKGVELLSAPCLASCSFTFGKPRKIWRLAARYRDGAVTMAVDGASHSQRSTGTTPDKI